MNLLYIIGEEMRWDENRNYPVYNWVGAEVWKSQV